MRYIDLHIHTTASDGMWNPAEAVKKAAEAVLKAIAITDHDNIAGIEEALKAGKKYDIEVIPGIEVSVNDSEGGNSDIHILGYFIDHRNDKLIQYSKDAAEARISQKKAMIKNLQKLGYNIDFKEVTSQAGNVLGRPHIAKVLMKKYPEEFPDMDCVFRSLLSSKGKAFAPREDGISMQKAIDLIKAAKGIPILSHPEVYPGVDAEKLIQRFLQKGGKGIETFYPYDKLKKHKGISKEELDNLIMHLRELCKKYHILESGGTDCHGTHVVELGDVKVPYSVLEKMKEHLTGR